MRSRPVITSRAATLIQAPRGRRSGRHVLGEQGKAMGKTSTTR